jgi:hypothetical protein
MSIPVLLLAATLSLTASPAQDAAQSIGALRGIRIDDEMDTNVPPAASLLIANAKHHLRDLAAAVLVGAEPNAVAAAAHARNTMIAAVDEEGVDVGGELGVPYGDGLTIEVTSPGPGFVAVVVDFSVPCGTDSSLFLFRRTAGGWKLVLDRENNDYETVAGAAGSFEFKLSPPDANGAVLVLTTDINPWCSSNWQSLRWDLFRVGQETEPIESGRESVFLQGEITSELRKDGFTLRFTGSSIDPGRVARGYVRNYHVEEGHLELVEPYAETALEYVEEWLARNADEDLPTGEFATPERCDDGVWRIELDFYGETDDEEIPIYFFVAEEKEGRFRMVAVTSKPDRESEPAQLPTKER